MADFEYNFERGEHDPDTVTNINCYFEPGIDANRIHAFIEDLGHALQKHGVQSVIEKMQRTTENKLYVRIGFRQMDIEEDEEKCMGK